MSLTKGSNIKINNDDKPGKCFIDCTSDEIFSN